MNKSFSIAVAALMLCVAINLSATPADAGFFADLVDSFAGQTTGSGR